MIFFTSDTHFGHRNILEYCKRPWSSVLSMDAGLVDSWNRVVRDDDTVYHLGDVSFHPNDGSIETIFSTLKGKKILVPGNHDRDRPWKAEVMSTIFDQVLPLLHEFTYHGYLFSLCHFPLEQWNRNYKGSFHLHGHTHGTSRVLKYRMDVGCDSVGYTPISIDEVIETLKKAT